MAGAARHRSRRTVKRAVPGARGSKGWGGDGAGPARQRVAVAAVGGADPLETSRHAVSPSRAASDRRRAGVRSTALARAMAAANALERSASSKTERV